MSNMAEHAVTMDTLLTKLPHYVFEFVRPKVDAVFKRCSECVEDAIPSQQNKVG